jgi:hypothetical protein
MGPEWTSIAALAAGGPALETRLAAQNRLALPERTRHAWFVEKVAWYVAAVAGDALLKGGRLPPLEGDAVWLRFDAEGMPVGIEAAGPGEASVGADGIETAGPGEASVVAHGIEAAGPGGAGAVGRGDALGAALAGLLEGPIRALVARGPARARSLWRHAADRVADALLWTGDACGDPAAGRALAVAAAAPGTPLAIPLRFDATGRLRRVSCCQSYRLEGEPTCDNCPLRGPRGSGA